MSQTVEDPSNVFLCLFSRRSSGTEEPKVLICKKNSRGFWLNKNRSSSIQFELNDIQITLEDPQDHNPGKRLTGGGFSCFPGGKKETVDTSDKSAAFREFLEVTGIDLSETDLPIKYKYGEIMFYDRKDRPVYGSLIFIEVSENKLNKYAKKISDNLQHANYVNKSSLIRDREFSTVPIVQSNELQSVTVTPLSEVITTLIAENKQKPNTVNYIMRGLEVIYQF
jgi:8-oxo-dGTP pyrophosphatase MutT (NUDIX family)